MEIPKTCWLEDFSETCQDIEEDALLLRALSLYLFCDGPTDCFPRTLFRLSNYLSQHALDLRCLERRLAK